MKAAENLVGIPYEALDCWGLVKEFYLQEFGYPLSTYYEVPVTDLKDRERIIKEKEQEFSRVCLTRIKFGDILTFKVQGIESHTGVYLGKGLFLHAREGRDSCIERLTAKNGLILSGAFRVKTRGNSEADKV